MMSHVELRTSGLLRQPKNKVCHGECDTRPTDAVTWIRQTFLQPLRLLHQLSFPTLLTVYKALVTLAVTSASAERVMSKVKMVKTRLRSTLILQ